MIKDRMIKSFREANGGLFGVSEKADVGTSYQEMAKRGVVLMGWADPYMPDRSFPDHLKVAFLEALEDPSASHYTAPVGSSELKQVIAEKLKKFNKLDVIADRNILITPGSDSGLYLAILPFIEKGDEVLIPSPSYPNNYTDVEIMGGKPVPVLLREEDGYQLDIKVLEEKVTDRTKMLILTHPNNPTTTVYNRRSLEGLRDLCVKHDLILVCDQAFEDYTFENEMITPASLEGMWERTLSVFSYSKGFGLSGLRVGYIVACDEIMDSLYANAVAVIGATSTIAQNALLHVYEDPAVMEEFAKTFDSRRRKAYEIFKDEEKLSCTMPESGFLFWLDVSKLGDSGKIVSYLLEKANVSVNDGNNYGPGGKGHLRIVLGVYKDDEVVCDALYRIRDALREYGKLKDEQKT